MQLANIVETQGGYCIEGAMTFATINDLYEQLVKILKNNDQQTLILDLSAVTEIDSSAIALLVAMDQRAKLTLINTDPNILSLITLYGVDWLAPSTETH